MRAGILNPLGGCSQGAFCSPSQCVKKKNGETWHQSQLVDQELHQLLEKVDADLAQEACQKGCLFCHGKLHRADFDRKPRGGPQWDRRYSFCCAEEDCRRRRTPGLSAFPGAQGLCGPGGRVDLGDDSWAEARTGPSDPGSIANRLAHVEALAPMVVG